MNDISSYITKIPGKVLLAGASLSTLAGLVFMVAPSFIKDNSLVIMGGMTLGHVFGLLGVLLFAASIMHEIITGEKVSLSSKTAETHTSSDAADSADSENIQVTVEQSSAEQSE